MTPPLWNFSKKSSDLVAGPFPFNAYNAFTAYNADTAKTVACMHIYIVIWLTNHWLARCEKMALWALEQKVGMIWIPLKLLRLLEYIHS